MTYDDGTPIRAPHIRLTFVPINPPPSGDNKIFAPNGRADVENPQDGSFSFVTSHNADGLLPGKHKVIVIPLDERARPIDGIVPPEYREADKSPAVVDTAEQPMKIRVKKPVGGVRPVTGNGGRSQSPM